MFFGRFTHKFLVKTLFLRVKLVKTLFLRVTVVKTLFLRVTVVKTLFLRVTWKSTPKILRISLFLRVNSDPTRKLPDSTLKLHQRSSLRVTVIQYFPSLDKLVEYFDFGYLSNLDKFERVVWLFNLTHKSKLTHKLKLTRKEKTYA